MQILLNKHDAFEFFFRNLLNLTQVISFIRLKNFSRLIFTKFLRSFYEAFTKFLRKGDKITQN